MRESSERYNAFFTLAFFIMFWLGYLYGYAYDIALGVIVWCIIFVWYIIISHVKINVKKK